MDKLNMSSVMARLKAETPPFWKKIRSLMIACGAVGGSIVMLPVEYITFLPDNTGGILVTIGAVGTALSSLTAKLA